MPCTCAQQASTIRINGTISNLFPAFEIIETADWELLLRCPSCGQYWKVDQWDKYTTQMAIKLDGPQDWTAPDIEKRKAYLAASRGLDHDECSWINCQNLRLRGSAYCVDHLYAVGVRE
jgi:hypothetical protein